jgi:signal transduction histidine kinase
VFRRLGRESLYLLVGFPIAIVAFTVIVTGLSLGAGLLITLIGFPVLVATLFVASWFADVERWSIDHWAGHLVERPRYRSTVRSDSALRKLFVPLGDPRRWIDALFCLVSFVTSTVTWTVAVTWWATAVGGLTFPAWGWATQHRGSQDLPELLGFGNAYGTRVVFYVVAGVVAAATLIPVIRLLTAAQVGVHSALLSQRTGLDRQVEAQVAGRAAARSAEASALRQLERDIHDGPQQRLVRLSMDLGRVRRQVADDPGPVRDTLDDALRQTQDTLDELRALSRGIAPPVLADRGLRAALEELAARSTVPVALHTELPSTRLPAHVETAVYFVVSESLTNVAKHSGADHAWVSVAVDAETISVQVTDNGRGGAHPAKGQGLAGLTERVRAADGALTCSSPDGGPTTIGAAMPCAS